MGPRPERLAECRAQKFQMQASGFWGVMPKPDFGYSCWRCPLFPWWAPPHGPSLRKVMCLVAFSEMGYPKAVCRQLLSQSLS